MCSLLNLFFVSGNDLLNSTLYDKSMTKNFIGAKKNPGKCLEVNVVLSIF